MAAAFMLSGELVDFVMVAILLVAGRLVAGRLVTGRLVTSRLVAGRLVSGRWVTGRLVTDRLVTGRLAITSVAVAMFHQIPEYTRCKIFDHNETCNTKPNPSQSGPIRYLNQIKQAEEVRPSLANCCVQSGPSS
jgi:hypothetical protein